MASRTIFLNAPGGEEIPRRLLERAITLALEREGVGDAELSVTFLQDGPIAELNRSHLSHEGPTDVISFVLHGEGEPPLGDVYVGVEQGRRQALEAGVPFEEELVRLAVHGVLHVLGYEHPEAAEERAASPQYRRQEALVRQVFRDEAHR